jgi:hypothetical protein
LNRENLAPLLPALVASLIHHYRDMCREVTVGHKILDMLRSSVMAAMTVDYKEAHLKLMNWSDTIKNDFVLGNAIALGRKSPGESDLLAIIMNQASCITNLANKIDGLVNTVGDLKRAVAYMDATAVDLQHRKRGGEGGEGKGEEGERKKFKTLGSDFTSTAPAKKPTIKGEGRKNTKTALLKDYLFRQARGGHVNEKSLENWRDITQGEPNKVMKTMKQVKVTINESYAPKDTWEKLSIRNQDVEEMQKICIKVVGWVDNDVRGLEGKPTLKPGDKSKTVNTVVSIANRIQKAQAAKKKTEAKNRSIVGAFFGGGK